MSEENNKRALIITRELGVNRGTEMLIDGTIAMCHMAGITKIDVCGMLDDLKKDMWHNLQNSDFTYFCMYSKYRIPKVNNFLQKNRGKSLFFTFMNCFGILKKLHMYETIIIGGADNYDVYSKKPFEFNFLISLIKLFKKANARMILHDCSIAKNNINKFLSQT